MYIKLKQKYTKIILPQYVSAPSNISVALNELYLNNTIKINNITFVSLFQKFKLY